MSSVPPPESNPPTPRPGLLATLAQNHKTVGIVLLVAAALFVVIPIVLVARAATAPAAKGAESEKSAKDITQETPEEVIANAARPSWTDALGPTFFWGLTCAVACLVVGLGCFAPARGKLTELDRMRLMVLVLGASLGILTALLGMDLPFTQGFRAVFLGGAEEWRKGKDRILIVALALIGGLGLAFASLQLARGVERENVLMRRLLYGFSTVFTVLLLVAVLLLVNLLPYIPSRYNPLSSLLNATFDWTQARLYSLSDRSRATLANLKEPIKAYIFLDSRDPIGDEAQTMFKNCREATDKISWEAVSSTDRKKIVELFKEFKDPQMIQDQPDELGRVTTGIRPGILLVYGEKKEGPAGAEVKQPTAFLPRETLYVREQSREGGRETFQGEAVLMKAIRSLTERKLVIYFTQGDGELPFHAGPAGGAKSNGLDALQTMMRRTESFELKELTIGAGTTEVPKDADIVVVAQPRRMRPEALKALGTYMGYEYREADGSFTDSPGGRKGRLFVLTAVNLVDKKMEHSGLEPLLAKLGVSVGDDRVLNLDTGDPTALPVESDPNSTSPIARAFGPPNASLFVFEDPRPTLPIPGGSFQVENILVTASTQVWVDNHLDASPEDVATAKAREANPEFSAEPISVGVAVSDRGAVPDIPEHAGVTAVGGPRLLVFGASNWISNEGLSSQNTVVADYNLFTSCLSWLGGEPDVGTAPESVSENKDRPLVTLNFTSEGQYWATVLLPAAHMLLVVIAAGVGVWLVRRR
jgi:hypothetical protein